MRFQTAVQVVMQEAFIIHPNDTIAIALQDLEADSTWADIRLKQAIPKGHKLALKPIQKGASVRKYGYEIGKATQDIEEGEWVHSHNVATGLTDLDEYTYAPHLTVDPSLDLSEWATFQGYRRANGKVGTRNEIWVLNTVGCVTRTAERIARMAAQRFEGRVDGVHSFGHPFGCSQLGDDLQNTRAILSGLIQHPNAGGVLVIGLGCENNQMEALLALTPDLDRSRLRFFKTQMVEDEIEAGLAAVEELVAIAEQDKRETCAISDLVIGVKCGGSDGFSGITANPLVGRITDVVATSGGTVVQTEVPEMFGAENVLMARAENNAVFSDLVSMIQAFKAYFIRHNQPIYENPSPGNKDGGLTTLEEKSLGAIQKGGQAAIVAVLGYGDQVKAKGLNLLNAPGNDGISSTAMVASGATVLLFTTGRGTPLGFPVPTLKLATNSDLAHRKPDWIDFNAGVLVEGSDWQTETDNLLALILETASGKPACNEKNDYREIAIWKNGVTL